MIKTLLTALVFASMAFSLSAADSTNRLHFPTEGFSIAALEVSPGQATQGALMMFLPSRHGFAANVNVVIQPYTDTIDQYTTLTLSQFKEGGITLIQQKKAGASSVIFEYSGVVNGNTLLWYAKAEKSGDHVYLVTATANKSDWSKQSAQLKACVDSFKCEP
jgi:hypothetical protein